MNDKYKKQINYLDTIDSTNTYVIDNFKKLDGNSMTVARNQTSGKGQKNKEWISPSGGIYATYLIKSNNIKIDDTRYYSFVGCVTTLAIIKKYLNEIKNIWIKWPNDIYYIDKKISGVLCETIIENNIIVGMTIGIGINVNTDYNLIKDINGTSMTTIKKCNFDIKKIIDDLYEYIYFYCNDITTEKKEKVMEIWKNEHLFLIGKNINIMDENNIKIIIKIISVMENGGLLVKDKDNKASKIYVDNLRLLDVLKYKNNR